MNRPQHLALQIGRAVLALSLCAAASAQVLNAPAERISDEAIHADYETYARQQSDIRALNDTGRHPVRSFSLAKAQCWLDVSFHEYSRNDRSAFVQQALTQSHRITEFLGAGGAVDDPQNPARQTPLVNDAARLREDLWARAAMLRNSAGFHCVEQQVACGEVELVHAGNEYNQQQWRHAKPYIQIAEDLLDDARDGASRCEPVPVAVTPAAAPPPVPLPALQEESLLAQVMFRFDRSARDDILPASLAQVRELVQRLQDGHHTVVSVRLVGHADRLNGTGDAAYNTRLSERRSLTVRELLVSLGVAQALIDTSALGDRGQIEPCAGRFASKSELEACLLPNRRVEILVQATRSMP
jgi:outer membrane protein OmpA-like peptidoglycan-associated protein